MRRKRLIVAGLAAIVCVGAASYAAPRRVTARDRALALRAKYDPFTMKRQPAAAARTPAAAPAPVPTAARPSAPVASNPAPRPAPQAAAPAAAPATVRVEGTAVRPPYRPATRSPYQPPVRGPYLSSSRR